MICRQSLQATAACISPIENKFIQQKYAHTTFIQRFHVAHLSDESAIASNWTDQSRLQKYQSMICKRLVLLFKYVRCPFYWYGITLIPA